MLSVPMRVLSLIKDRCVLAFINSHKICGEWGGLTRVISVPSWAAAWASRHSTYKSCSCHLAASSSFVKLSNCCWVSFTRLGCLGECGLLGFPLMLLFWGLLGEDGPADFTSLHSSAISLLIVAVEMLICRSLYRAQDLVLINVTMIVPLIKYGDAVDVRRYSSKTEKCNVISIKHHTYKFWNCKLFFILQCDINNILLDYFNYIFIIKNKYLKK